jgi:hypothetical protein
LTKMAISFTRAATFKSAKKKAKTAVTTAAKKKTAYVAQKAF